LNSVKNEVFRKIGRNVVLFQQLEQLLKSMIVASEIRSSADGLPENQAKRAEMVAKQTMGALGKSFREDVFVKSSDARPERDTSIESSESLLPGISTRFYFQVEDDFHEDLAGNLNSLVVERNELIHQLPVKWNLNSLDGCRALEAHLDVQQSRFLPVMETLTELHCSMFETMKECGEFLQSDEGKRQFALATLRQSRLVVWLCDIAKNKARSDGWVVFDKAKQVVRDNAPEELTQLEKRHGYKRLQDAMLATEWFELSEEMTTKNGRRMIYRIKPGLVFDD
jgi:hypothetical protein